LLILAGLRRLEDVVEQEVRKMPVLIDILDNKVLGREFKRGLEEGKIEGKVEGELTALRRLLEKRFGNLPAWVDDRLVGRSAAELVELIVRAIDAPTLEDLLR